MQYIIKIQPLLTTNDWQGSFEKELWCCISGGGNTKDCFFLHYRAIKSIYHHRKVMKLTSEQAYSPLSVWVETKNCWFLRQRASAQNISLSTLIFMVSFQVHSCNSQFNTNKTKFSLSATLLNQTWFSAAKWEHICNQ